jgi:hypothetical protein
MTDVMGVMSGVSVLQICSAIFAYFGLLVFAFGEGDASGEGLAAGLGLVAGALSAGPLREAEVLGEGLGALGEFELLPGSQPAAAKTIENVVRSSRAVRPMMFMFGVIISFGLVSARLKSMLIIAPAPISSNGCSHRRFAGISAQSAPKPSFSREGLARLANAGQEQSAGAVGRSSRQEQSAGAESPWNAGVCRLPPADSCCMGLFSQ